jgi:hypothetical protein
MNDQTYVDVGGLASAVDVPIVGDVAEQSELPRWQSVWLSDGDGDSVRSMSAIFTRVLDGAR